MMDKSNMFLVLVGCIFLYPILTSASTAIEKFTLMMQSDFNCLGHTLYSLTLNDLTVEECAFSCLRDSSCRGFAFQTLPSENYCYLKDALCPDPVVRANSEVYVPHAFRTILRKVYESGLNCPSDTLLQSPDDYKTCRARCLIEEACVGVTYSINSQDFSTRCKLKSALCDNPEKQHGYYVFIKEELPNGYLQVEDASSVISSSAVLSQFTGIGVGGCQYMCDSDDQCQAFQVTVSKSGPICVTGLSQYEDGGYNVFRVVYQKMETPLNYTLQAHGFDCPGGYIDSIRRKYSRWCAKYCDDNPACVGFVWEEAAVDKNCWIKGKKCNDSELVPNPLHSLYNKQE